MTGHKRLVLNWLNSFPVTLLVPVVANSRIGANTRARNDQYPLVLSHHASKIFYIGLQWTFFLNSRRLQSSTAMIGNLGHAGAIIVQKSKNRSPMFKKMC